MHAKRVSKPEYMYIVFILYILLYNIFINYNNNSFKVYFWLR